MFFAYAAFVIGFVFLLFLANMVHLEKGGTGDNAHKTTGLAWLFIALSLIIGMFVGGLPGMHENIVKPALEKGGVDFSASADTNASASASASASATTGSLQPSKEGIRLMDQFYPQITKKGRKLTNFQDAGNDWYWCVVDSSVSATAGQDVVGGEYEVSDASVTEVTVFLAKKVGGTYEFGDRRIFSLK